jgi:integrase
MGKLSERKILTAKATDSELMLNDGAGLYVRVYPTGRKVFIYRYRNPEGTTKKIILGLYPTYTLTEAREATAKYNSKRAIGLDPAKEKEAIETRQASETANSKEFQDAYSTYYAHLCKEYSNPEQTDSMMKANVLPKLQGRIMREISKAEYMQLVQAVVNRGSPVMANRLFSQLRKMLGYCKDQGWIEVNPLADVVRRNVGGKEKPKTRNLSFEEIKGFFQLDLSANMFWPLYLILLCGVRSSEALWILRNKRLDGIVTKETLAEGMGPHTVPAIPAIRAVLRLAEKQMTVIPADHRALSKSLLRLQTDYTPHDLRRTMASRMGDLKVMPHVVEKLLHHKMVGVMAVYNHAEFMEEREAALRLWARKLRELRREARK